MPAPEGFQSPSEEEEQTPASAGCILALCPALGRQEHFNFALTAAPPPSAEHLPCLDPISGV